MSGWIKLEKRLETDPRVLRVAKFKRPQMPARRKRELARRYGCERGTSCDAACYWCGEVIKITWRNWALDPEFAPLTMDHVLPLSRGGTHDLDNLVLACGFCNSSRSARTTEEWLS